MKKSEEIVMTVQNKVSDSIEKRKRDYHEPKMEEVGNVSGLTKGSIGTGTDAGGQIATISQP